MNDRKQDDSPSIESQLIHLTDALSRYGFNSKMDVDLRQKLKEDPDKFIANTWRKYDNEKINYAILFKKFERLGLYFPTSYRAELDNDKSKNRVFSLNDNVEIKAREAFNLLQGRSILRLSIEEDARFPNKWIALDFHNKDDHGNAKMDVYRHGINDYMLSRILNRYPIKECKVVEDKVDLIIGLSQGNREQVRLENNGREQRLFIEACPRERDFNFFNRSNVKLDRRDLMRKPEFPKISTMRPQRKGRSL